MRDNREQKRIDLLAEYAKTSDLVRCELAPLEAFAVVAALQLSLRHPQNTGHPAELVRNVIVRLQQKFPQDVAAISRLGDAREPTP